MTNQKTDRNKQIYEDYINLDTSFNKLSQKYNLSPQRINSIVNAYKTQGLENSLSARATKEEREKFKNLAIEKRESGKTEISISMFEQVVAWDKANDNIRGMDDVFGHIQIAYNSLVKNTSDNTKKIEYLNKSEKYLNESLKLAEQGKLLEGAITRTKVNIAKFNLLKSTLVNEEEKTKLLNSALDSINDAVVNLAGSLAAKAWPLITKAQILHKQDKSEMAVVCLRQAEDALFTGYEQQINWSDYRVKKQENLIGNDQAVIKLNAWLAGINLTYAQICLDLHKNVLAKHYASAVIAVDDPEGLLIEQKKKAKAILAEL